MEEEKWNEDAMRGREEKNKNPKTQPEKMKNNPRKNRKKDAPQTKNPIKLNPKPI